MQAEKAAGGKLLEGSRREIDVILRGKAELESELLKINSLSLWTVSSDCRKLFAFHYGKEAGWVGATEVIDHTAAVDKLTKDLVSTAQRQRALRVCIYVAISYFHVCLQNSLTRRVLI